MVDVRQGPSSDEETVTINAEFVRKQAKAAVRQFFRPLTAPFEGYSAAKGAVGGYTSLGGSSASDLLKSGRVEMRGYAVKKRRRA